MTEWFFSLSRDLCVASMINRSTEEMDGRQAYLAVKIFQTAEQDLNDDPDKTLWESYCGKYEQRLSLPSRRRRQCGTFGIVRRFSLGELSSLSSCQFPGAMVF